MSDIPNLPQYTMCGNCHYFIPSKAAGAIFGECRKYAPKAERYTSRLYPEVHPDDDGCFEGARKP